jgi:integrase
MTDNTAFSEKTIAKLGSPRKGNKLHYFSGAMLQGRKAPSGFAVRVTAAGTRSFVWFHRVNGKGYLETIGTWSGNAGGGTHSALQAIVAAKARSDEINKPGSVADPRPARTRAEEERRRPHGKTIADLLDEHVARYVEKEAKLRSAAGIKSAFDRLVKPQIGGIGIYELRRSHVVEMLDTIADKKVGGAGGRMQGGPVEADRVLSHLKKAFNWYAARDDEFMPPIVKGMARTKPKERARDRVLADAEIRHLWKAVDAIAYPACYPSYVRFVLHTATRLNEAALMRWDEIDGDVWTIPAVRYKTKRDHIIPLSKAALALIGPRSKDNEAQPFVFSPNGGTKPLTNHQQAMAAIRKALGSTPHWVLHDLRRTARSIMSRAGVSWDHAERCLGHVIGGVRETYDRHAYFDEKKKAFGALEAQINRILNPKDNVTDLAKQRRTRG